MKTITRKKNTSILYDTAYRKQRLTDTKQKFKLKMKVCTLPGVCFDAYCVILYPDYKMDTDNNFSVFTH